MSCFASPNILMPSVDITVRALLMMGLTLFAVLIGLIARSNAATDGSAGACAVIVTLVLELAGTVIVLALRVIVHLEPLPNEEVVESI